jgi:NAD(P)-dependent dehydrogenase (short-subunit alcohol dehydrogenase family)
MDIAGRIAVVTGAAAGAGRVIAQALADLGALVVVADIDGEGAQAACTAIGRRGGTGQAVRADICDELGVEAIAAGVSALTDLRVRTGPCAVAGGPHILVNNAGGWGPAGRQFPLASPVEWGAVLDLNLRAPMRLTQRFLPAMTEAGGGAVVNVSSSAARGDQPYASPEYGAAKAGLIRFTTALGGLSETMGVRVNCIVPDWIGLDRAHAELAEMPPAQRAAMPPFVPPQAVARTVIALIHDDSLSGRVVALPGGDSIQWL